MIAEEAFFDPFESPGFRFFFRQSSQRIGPVDAPGIEHADANGVFRAKKRAPHAHDATVAETHAPFLVEGDVSHGAERYASLAGDATALVDAVKKRIDETSQKLNAEKIMGEARKERDSDPIRFPFRKVFRQDGKKLAVHR